MDKTFDETNNSKPSTKKIIFGWIADIAISMIAAIVVALGLHVFANDSVEFVPGGITGLAKIFSLWTGKRLGWGVFLLILNIPIFLLEAIFVDKKLGIILSVYAITQAAALSLFEKIGVWQYEVQNWERIYAAIAAGVVTGIGYSIQIMRHGASGGTYSISSLIKHWNPSANIAWLSFAMDASVILLAFFQFRDSSISSVICTFINLFIADIVVDKCLKGTKDGYKFEIITDEPEGISKRIMHELNHGVTEVSVHGMYSDKDKFMVVCIIRKRELSNMMRILKEYPSTFASFSHVNEVFGKFKK